MSGPCSVDGLFRAQVARSPNAVAVESDEGDWTYAALDAWVDDLAGRLAAVAAGPERVVAVAVPRSAALVAGLLAVARTGAAYLPVDTELPVARIDHLLGDARPVAVVHAPSTAWVADRAGVAGVGATEASGRPVPAPAVAVDPGTPVYVIYTSGSTGRPKGVVMATAAILNLLAWHLDELGTGPGRRVAQFTAVGFDIAAQEIFSTLVSGATLVVPSEDTRRDPNRFVRWMERERITDLFCPNIVLEAVAEAALAAGHTLPHLAHVAQAGEQLSLSDHVRDFFRLRPGRRLHNHYGPTETHAATSSVLPADVDDWPARASIGGPIWNTDVHLLDADLRPVPLGSEGEVFVSGAALARGYHDRPDLTADRFVPDPFAGGGRRMYRTGDVARQRPDGDLEYLGRADQQVKVRGVRIELGEVEAALRGQPEVQDVAVLIRGDGDERRLDAYLVPVPGERDVVEAVRTRLRETLPAVMVPATFTLLPELPVNANGKVDRNGLPEPAPAASAAAERPAAASRDDVLARLFAEALDVGEVSRDDDFFLLGGHSLSAARLAAQVRSLLGVDVTIADVFRNPSVGQLATVLGAMTTRVPPVTPVGRTTPLPVSFAQERLWVVEQLAGESALYNVPVVVRLAGPLDVDCLRAAVRDVVGRHEALRTTIDGDGELHQHVAGEDDVPFEVVEVEPGRVADAVRRAAERPFRLDTDVPCRALLFGGDDEHTLLLSLHHIACDGWSLKPLTKDLGFAYAARLAGLAPPWRPLHVQYGDYAAWQRRLFEPGASDVAAEQAAYWRAVLAGAPEVIVLPTDRPRPPMASGRGTRVPVVVDRATHAALRDVAARSACTPFMAVHAALAAVLHHWGAGEDVVVGATVAGRADGALDDLVGFFVNTLALRLDLSGDPSTGELLCRTRETDLAAMANQELPFDKVVEVVNPVRSTAWNPVVQVMLAFQTGVPEPPPMPHLDSTVELLDLGVAKFDLCFELTEREDVSGVPDGIVGHLEVATDLYDRPTAERLAADLVAAVGVLAAGGCGSLTDLGHHLGRRPAPGSLPVDVEGRAS